MCEALACVGVCVSIGECMSEWVSVSEGVCVSVHLVVCVCEGLARMCVVGGAGSECECSSTRACASGAQVVSAHVPRQRAGCRR